MTKYVINSPFDHKPLYATSDFGWTFNIKEAMKFNSINEAQKAIREISHVPMPKIDTYKLELSEVISDSLKLL